MLICPHFYDMSRLGRNTSIDAGRDMDGPINPTSPGNQFLPRKAGPPIAVELAGARPRPPPSQMGRRRATWSSARDARANSRAEDASEVLRYEPRYCVYRCCTFFLIPKQHVVFDGAPQPLNLPKNTLGSCSVRVYYYYKQPLYGSNSHG